MSEPAKPGIFDRLRARFGLLDHVVRAYQHFDARHGGFFAAGLTYYTIFALFPLLMVGFAAVGFVLSRRHQLLRAIDEHIRVLVPSELGQQLVELMNSAVDARASVGVIGLAAAAWAGLGWMSHLRLALTEMWSERPTESPGYVRNKLSDVVAMLGTFVVILGTIALTALSHAAPMHAVLRWFEIPEFSGSSWILRGVSIAISVLVTWLLLAWMIARLPREKVSVVAALRAALMAAIGFELLKQVASIYLQVVLRSAAGAAFGPVLGLMVFAYFTGYLVLFCTAWAATASSDARGRHVNPPAPAIIAPRVQLNEGIGARQTLTALALGAVGALALSRLTRWFR